jgi:hypothetical protein
VLLPGDPNPPLNLARTFESLRRFDEAVRAFREVLRRSPGNSVAIEHLNLLLPPGHRPADAREARRS